MLEYGAVNAGNLDGGSSSVMVYDGEIINHCASVTGPRRIPTGFIVLKEVPSDA
jgi:bla regulator protein BlaR1